MSKKKNKKRHNNSLRESRNEVFKSTVSAPAQVAHAKIVIASKDDIPAELPDDVSAEVRKWVGAKAGAKQGANKGRKPCEPLEFDGVEDLINVCRERIQKRAEKRAEAAEHGKPKRKRTTTKKAEASESKKEEKESDFERLTLPQIANILDVDVDRLTQFVESERATKLNELEDKINALTEYRNRLKKKVTTAI